MKLFLIFIIHLYLGIPVSLEENDFLITGLIFKTSESKVRESMFISSEGEKGPEEVYTVRNMEVLS